MSALEGSLTPCQALRCLSRLRSRMQRVPCSPASPAAARRLGGRRRRRRRRRERCLPVTCGRGMEPPGATAAAVMRGWPCTPAAAAGRRRARILPCIPPCASQRAGGGRGRAGLRAAEGPCAQRLRPHRRDRHGHHRRLQPKPPVPVQVGGCVFQLGTAPRKQRASRGAECGETRSLAPRLSRSAVPGRGWCWHARGARRPHEAEARWLAETRRARRPPAGRTTWARARRRWRRRA